MSNNPINLAVRFLLEVAALVAVGVWGWNQASGVPRFLLALGLPVLAAALWGTFRVPEDASASGRAPVKVPGIVRLGLEWGLFAFATWGLYDVGRVAPALILGAVAVIHYLVSFDRVIWLLRH